MPPVALTPVISSVTCGSIEPNADVPATPTIVTTLLITTEFTEPVALTPVISSCMFTWTRGVKSVTSSV